MSEAQLIGQRQNTHGDSRSTPGQRTLPPDLLRQASRRLQILALIGATLWLLGPVFGHLALYSSHPENHRWAEFGGSDIIAAIQVVIGLGLYTYLRTRERDPVFVLDLALVFMVVSAAGIALMFHVDAPAAAPTDTRP